MRAIRHHKWLVGLGLLVLGLSVTLNVAGTANAAIYFLPQSVPSLDDEFPIVQGPDDLLRPTIADGSPVVWYARGVEGFDVFGLRLDTSGGGEGEPFLVGGGSGDQAVPAIASSTEGGSHLVVWHEHGDRSADFDVYARYLDAMGTPQDEPFVISTAEGDQLRPAVSYSVEADKFVVVWQDNKRTGDFDLHARLVPAAAEANGRAPVLEEEFVVSSAFSEQLIPAVACEVDVARCLVVWMDDRNVEALYNDIIGRLIDAGNGVAIGDKIDVAVELWHQDSPTAIYNPIAAEYLVVWNDDISCRRVSRDGWPLGYRIDVSLESPFQYKPAVAIDDEGRYLIVWEDGRNQGSRGTDIYGQWLSSAGVPVGSNFVVSGDSHNQYWPTLTFDREAGAFLSVWEDDRSNDSLSLFGRMLAGDPGDQ